MNLLEPVLTGIKSTNFFEGRLLTAQDLRDQQVANEKHRWRLGKAIGSGVVEGLEVTLLNNGLVGSPPRLVPPVVRIDKGMAINGRGQALELTTDFVEVQLARELPAPDLSDQPFNDCQPPTTSNIPNGEGVYLLVVSPALGFEGYAPKSGLGLEEKAIGCGRRYTVEGVQFRLEPVAIDQFPELDEPRDDLRKLDATAAAVETVKAVSLLRNAVAHAALKTSTAAEQRARIRQGEPAAFRPATSITDLLTRNKALTDCDIPLAVLFWDLQGVRFLDTWSFRRLARWLPSADDISLLQTSGLERLLQFQDHINELLNSSQVLEQFEIEDLFRYVPPAAYIPVKGANSRNGFDQQDFMGSFFRPPLNDISAGLFADVLKKSLHLAAIDLQSHAYLHTYRIVENELALANDVSSQRFHAFCSSDTNDIRIEDGLVVPFETAWSVYGGLLKQRTFIPPADDPARIIAVNSITHSVRNVMDIANRQASVTASNVLNYSAALKAYRWLYDAQAKLAEYFQTNIPGITDTQDRESFGASLEGLLDDTLFDGGLALKPALEASNLVAAIDAQNAINTFVGSWSGEGIALGPFGIINPNRLAGRFLVPEADPIPVRFTLVNGTDKALGFGLQAELEPVEDFPQPTILKEIGGEEIDSLRLTRGSRTTIVVMVSAPPINGVSLGDKPNLIMTANTPAPTSRTSRIEYPDLLEVGAEQGDAEEGSLTFVDPPVSYVPPTDPGNIGQGVPFSIVLNAHYENENTTPRTFTVEVTVTASTAISGWGFATPIDLGVIEENTVDPNTRILSYTLENRTPSTGVLEFVGVGAVATAPDATDIDISIAIRSTDDEPEISAEYGEAIRLSVA